jgi:predicted HD phosphohydrolase
LKQLIANRAEAPKSFGDLPEILQLKFFELARVPGPLLETWEADVRTPVVLRAVNRRWKRLIDFADDPTYHPECSYFVDAQLRHTEGPNEIEFVNAWRRTGWTIDSLRREFLEW